jgi:hypothetical protein
MAKIHYSVTTDLSPATVIAALTDFGPQRAARWPDLDASAFEVLELGEDHALVREGTERYGIWVVERYEWKTPGVIRAVCQDSNVVLPGGLWQTTVSDRPGGGSRLDVIMDRRPKGVRGRGLHALLQVAGPVILGRSLRGMLKKLGRPA